MFFLSPNYQAFTCDKSSSEYHPDVFSKDDEQKADEVERDREVHGGATSAEVVHRQSGK